MLITRGIAMTDGLNRKNHYISLNAILNAYENAWKYGTPSNLNHDSTKFVGWTFVNGIYMEPGKAYVINEMQIPENSTEHKNLIRRNMDYLYRKYYLERKDKYDELKELLGNKLSDKSRPALINCVAYEDQGIVYKIFPEMRTDMHKGLINLKQLTPILPGVYKKDKYLIFAHRFFRRNCSMLNSLNDEFLQRLQNLATTNLNVQIAIDPDLIGLLGTEMCELEYQYWWGPKFNEDLSMIPLGVTKHENEGYDNVFSNLCFTEFGWYMQDDRQTFECEEVIDKANIQNGESEYYGCRFVHSMLNPLTQLPNHLDGAIRAYTDEQIIERLEKSIDKSERDSWYTKLWRIDSDMSVSLWKELITHYYRDNRLIGEYFCGQDDQFQNILLEDKSENEIVPLEKYVPVNMSKGDGIRFYFRYLPKISVSKDYDVVIRSNEFLIYNQTKIKVMETETVTVLKLLKRYGIKVRFPVTSRIAHEDMILNFPVFVCANYEVASKVQQAMYDFCVVWNEQNDDRLISYTIIVNENDEAIELSFAGHVDDIVNVFNDGEKRFPDKQNLYKWIENLYIKNNKNRIANQYPRVNDILIDGTLRYRRQIVPAKYLHNIELENNNVMVKFVEKKEIVTEITENKIGIAPIYLIEKTRCTKCGGEYSSCNCIKFIDECSEEITKFNFLGATWTNRHA